MHAHGEMGAGVVEIARDCKSFQFRSDSFVIDFIMSFFFCADPENEPQSRDRRCLLNCERLRIYIKCCTETTSTPLAGHRYTITYMARSESLAPMQVKAPRQTAGRHNVWHENCLKRWNRSAVKSETGMADGGWRMADGSRMCVGLCRTACFASWTCLKPDREVI